MIFVVCCVLCFGFYCSINGVRCLWFVVWYVGGSRVLFVVFCDLFDVGCCSMFVVCV